MRNFLFLVFFVVGSGCIHLPPGRLAADVVIYFDKQVNGGEITLTEEALRQHEQGNAWGSAKNLVYNLIMAPIDLLWTGTVFCHGYVWRSYEATGEAVCRNLPGSSTAGN